MLPSKSKFVELKKQNPNLVEGTLSLGKKEISMKKRAKLLKGVASIEDPAQFILSQEKLSFQEILNIQEDHLEKDPYKLRKNKKLTTMLKLECQCL